MRCTNIELDEQLVNEAIKLTHLRTKKALVHHALEEVVRVLKRRRLLELEGGVEWEGYLDEMRSPRP